MTRHAERAVYAFCPYCKTPVPVLTVTVEVSGWIRRRCDVLVNGDASDFVAHMWMHEQQAKAGR
jgi:hypothetical protein